MLQGWISVHIQIQGHWLWADKPFSKGQAWIDMLMLANHEDKQILFVRKVVDFKAGSFITSEVKLAERWEWSRQKVRDFLDLLKAEKMIDKVSDNKKTTIFIENYAEYQDTCNSKLDSEKTSEKQQKNTNNNDNNANKELSSSFFCARTREEFSQTDVTLILARLWAKKIFVGSEEHSRRLQENGREETLKHYGIEERT